MRSNHQCASSRSAICISRSLLAASILAAASAPSARADNLVSGNSANWKASDAGDEFLFIGGEGVRSAGISIKKEFFKKTIAEVTIKTDSRIVTLRSGDSEFSVAVPPGEPLTLRFDDTGKFPTLIVNRAEYAAGQAKWTRTLAADETTVFLSLANPTHATIKCDVIKDGRPENPQAKAEAPAADKVKAIADEHARKASTIKEFLRNADTSVFLINAYDEKGVVIGSGSGFVADEAGLCVTNYHIIRKAASASAFFNGVKQPVKLDLVDVNPDIDLALLRIPKEASVSPAPVLLGAPKPSEGDDAWAVGCTADHELSIKKGAVLGVRTPADIPAQLADVLTGYEKKSQWVLTDCKVAAGGSGGPLVNAAGQCVGLIVVRKGGNKVYASLMADQISAAIKDIPKKPLTFTQAAKIYGAQADVANRDEVQVPSGLPHLDIPKDKKPNVVASDAYDLEMKIVKKCPDCDGKGVGSKHDACPKCHRTGKVRVSSDVAYGMVQAFIDDLSQTDPTASNFAAKLEESHSHLSHALAADEEMCAMLTDRFRGVVGQENVWNKKPKVAGVGWVVKQAEDKNTGVRVYWIKVATVDKTVILRSPILADPFAKGSHLCAFGGICSGKFEDDSEDSPCLVLQDGFIVSPPAGWSKEMPEPKYKTANGEARETFDAEAKPRVSAAGIGAARGFAGKTYDLMECAPQDMRRCMRMRLNQDGTITVLESAYPLQQSSDWCHTWSVENGQLDIIAANGVHGNLFPDADPDARELHGRVRNNNAMRRLIRVAP